MITSLRSRSAARIPGTVAQNSVEIHVQEGVSFWGTVADLDLGGCYVEIPIPLELGKRLKVGIWFFTNYPAGLPLELFPLAGTGYAAAATRSRIMAACSASATPKISRGMFVRGSTPQ
jgi:hypothetical protein